MWGVVSCVLFMLVCVVCGLLRDVVWCVFCVCMFFCVCLRLCLCACVLFVICRVMLHNSCWGCELFVLLCACVCCFNAFVDVACDVLCDAVRFACCFCVSFRVGVCFVTIVFVRVVRL